MKTASTPMEPNKALIKDEEADSVDVHLYRPMIGSLMYLTASRDSPFDLEAFSDSDYARASLDRKSTTGGCQFLGKRLISWQCKKQTIVTNSTTEAEYVVAANCCGQKPIIVPSSCQPKKTHKHRKAIRTIEISQSSGPINLVADETIYKEWEDRMEQSRTVVPRYHIGGVDAQTRFETTSKSSNDPPLSKVNTFGSGEDTLEFILLGINLIMPLSKIINYVKQIHDIVDGKAVGHIRIISESDLLFNDEYGYLDDLTNFVTPTTHDSPLSGGNTPGCDEGRMELIQELMETCSSLTKRVLSLEEAKTAQDRVITDLKFEGQEVEKKRKARTPQPMKRRLFQGRVETSTDKILEVIVEEKGCDEIRADGSSKNYKIFSEMLDDFDRQDVDLKTLFEPNEEDEIWKNQQNYNLISWRLFDSYRVHVLLMNTGVAIHMMIEKKYPLTQEMLLRMLNRRLKVDYESEMAFELLRFTRSQLQK
ncbi:hypothetical protein Tco_1141591 [Tanacetum coccineum]